MSVLPHQTNGRLSVKQMLPIQKKLNKVAAEPHPLGAVLPPKSPALTRSQDVVMAMRTLLATDSKEGPHLDHVDVSDLLKTVATDSAAAAQLFIHASDVLVPCLCHQDNHLVLKGLLEKIIEDPSSSLCLLRYAPDWVAEGLANQVGQGVLKRLLATVVRSPQATSQLRQHLPVWMKAVLNRNSVG